VGYITAHWSLDPFGLVAILLAAGHEVGLARLARRSRPERTAERRRRSLLFYAGLGVLVIAVQSPVDYWADDYFFVHMIQHLLLMFAAPTLVVAGAPWAPLLGALPGGLGRAAARSVLAGAWWRPARAVAGAALRPWAAVAIFNAVMVAWHVPALFDLAQRDPAVHIWLMHGSFFAAGVLFWLQFIGSPPLRIRMPPASQAAALLGTNVVMWVLAMSMGILSSRPWYPVYDHVPGVTLPPMADQQIGAGILWVCGDFWAVPCMIGVFRRLIDQDGDVSSALDRIVGGGMARAGWAGRGSRPAAMLGRPEVAREEEG
jgi:putative membrane protein